MKKQLLIYLIMSVAIIAVIVTSYIYNRKYKEETEYLENSCYVKAIETKHFSLEDIYILDYADKSKEYEHDISYQLDVDELSLVYMKDTQSDKYVAVYDKENVISNPAATFKVSYLRNQQLPLYEQADEKYNTYIRTETYDLLEHSYLSPEEDNHISLEDVYTYYNSKVYTKNKQDYYIFPQRLWDKEVYRFVISEREINRITEVIYFERTDGIYSVEMSYPAKNEEIRNMLYREFLFFDIHVDLNKLYEMRDNLEITESTEADGSLLVTIVNKSEHTIPYLHCGIRGKNEEEQGTYYYDVSPAHRDVKSGDAVSFLFSANVMEDFEEYQLDVTARENIQTISYP